MRPTRHDTFGIVLSHGAELQLSRLPSETADRLRTELVRIAQLGAIGRSSNGFTVGGLRVEVDGFELDYHLDPESGTVVALRVTPRSRVVQGARPLRILLVDDDRFDLTLIGDRLRHAGHEVTSVTSGLEALEHDLDAHDAIVCDFVMPGMGGGELLRRVRDERRCETRFIFITASRQPEELIRQSVRYDADFLPKPIDLAQLVDLIREGLVPPLRRAASGA
jgi:CheY-like chemotaxis protein